MRIKSFVSPFVLILTFTVVAIAVPVSARGQEKQGEPKLSSDEQSMLRAILAAPTPAGKLKAAGDFIKKYPKTPVRPRVARNAVDLISAVTDAAQKLSLVLEFQKIFNQPDEEGMIMPVLVEAYAIANQADEAFTRGGDFVSRNPEALQVLVNLLSAGTEQAKKQNGKFVIQSLQYGSKAIELIEANKKPASMEDATWQQFKRSMLPALYQSMGLLNLIKGDRAEAKARFIKASELAPTDAFNFVMLGGMLDEDYQAEAKKYQSMPPGPPKDEQMKKAQAAMDLVIDAFAHSIAVAEGNAALDQVRKQYMQDLETYYKFRHNNSTAGMQQLIDKYKTPAKP